MKTHIASQEQIEQSHQFYVVDAENVVLGRLASEVARLLNGKHKPIYSPFMDTGDHVIVVNADKVRLTGRKLDNKEMIHHTGYLSNLKKKSYRDVMDDNPDRIIRKAVWGMLPKNRLGRKMLKKLRVYQGPEHPHAAQKPVSFNIQAQA